MMHKLRSVLFGLFRRITRLLVGRNLGKIPGAVAAYNFLFRFLWPQDAVIEIQGSKMYVSTDNLPASYRKTFQSYIMSRGWERLTTDMFKKVVKEGDIVLDLGANIGYFTLLAARLVGEKGRVYAFEPEPTNYSLLLKNIELNRYTNVVALRKAVSDTTGTVKLFLDEKDTGAHTIFQSVDGKKFIEVESVSMDEFFKGRDQPINVIKMDVEGAEVAALSGMKGIIEANPGLKIFVEFYFPGIKRRGDSPEEFGRRLLQDFSIVAIGDYTKDKKYLTISTVDELMNLCQGDRTANLLLARRGGGA